MTTRLSRPTSGPPGAMLSVRDLVVHYGNITALKGISLFLAEGEVVTVIGANGAGKTTLLKSISGLLEPTSGQVEFSGRKISGLPPATVSGLGVMLVPEGRRIFGPLTVMENLELGAFLRRDREGITADLERMFTVFPRLAERRTQIAASLSGGEQQMLAIARALMARPKLLLLDEPSMGLAPIIVEMIYKTIREVNSEGTSVLLIEQNAHMALSVADRGYVLQNGEVVLQGTAEALKEEELVRAAYLGV